MRERPLRLTEAEEQAIIDKGNAHEEDGSGDGAIKACKHTIHSKDLLTRAEALLFLAGFIGLGNPNVRWNYGCGFVSLG